MQRPSWVTTIAILGIIFGALGLLHSMYLIMMPSVLDMERGFFSEMSKSQNAPPPAVAESMSKILATNESFRTIAVVFGSVRSLVNAFYLVSFILLLQMRPRFLKLVYWALGLSFVVTLAQAIALFQTGNIIGFSMAASSIFGILVDIILLVVILVSDKSAFALAGQQSATSSTSMEM